MFDCKKGCLGHKYIRKKICENMRHKKDTFKLRVQGYYAKVKNKHYRKE